MPDKKIEDVLSRLESEVNKHDIVPTTSGEQPVQIPTDISSFIKPPYLFFILVPICVLVVLFFSKPEFMMKEDPKTKVKKINFKNFLIAFFAITIGLEGVLYYYFFKYSPGAGK